MANNEDEVKFFVNKTIDTLSYTTQQTTINLAELDATSL